MIERQRHMANKQKRKYNFFFLLGAGASIPAVPGITDFVIEFMDHLNKRGSYFYPLTQYLHNINQEWQRTNDDKGIDLENLYELLININNPQNTIPLQLKIKGKWIKCRESELLEYELKKYIQKRCLEVNLGEVIHYKELFKFFELSPTLDVVSLNYDVCVEKFCALYKYRYDDEFYDDDQYLKPGTSSDPLVKLNKLHGSVNWYEITPGVYKRFEANNQFEASLKTGRLSTPVLRNMLIYPGIGKSAAMGLFLRPALNFRKLVLNCGFCISIGYRFADSTITSTIREGFLVNPDFRLIIINPNPFKALDNLLPIIKDIGKHSLLDFNERILIIDKRAAEVLADNYLFNRLRSWVNKKDFSIEKERTVFYTNKILKHIIKRSGQIDLIDDFPTDLYGIAIDTQNSRGYITKSGANGGLICFDLSNWNWKYIIKDLKHSLGIAIESFKSHTLIYLVENSCYQMPWLGKLQGKEGAGRIWKIRIDPNQRIKKELITYNKLQINLKKSVDRIDFLWDGYKEWHKEETLNKIHEEFGILNWPNSVLIENPNFTLLVTEARSLCRIKIKTGQIEKAFSIPLCFNLNDISLIDEDNLILLDVGVAGQNSYGRLLKGNLITGDVESILEGIPKPECLRIFPSRNSVLISKSHPFPYGEVIEVSLKNGMILRTWKGLDEPRGIAIAQNEKYALIASCKGLYKIML